MSVGPDPANDEVLAHRARLAALVKVGKRVGWGLFVVAIIVFGIGATIGFSGWMTTTIVVAMAAGSVLLAPAIVLGYGIRAAERDEREQAARAAGEPVPERRSRY